MGEAGEELNRPMVPKQAEAELRNAVVLEEGRVCTAGLVYVAFSLDIFVSEAGTCG